ncbi:MAG: porin [Alphaproteobacteria bacterium]|nr:porin [Alphaproteobacteria bacterium]
MNKILLATSALVGAVSLYAGAAMAAGPEVTVGGFLNFQVGHSSQKDSYETGNYSRKTHFLNDTEIHVKVDGKTDNGIGYGGVIELNADVTEDGDSDGVNADKTFLFVDTAWGRGEFGNMSGAEHILKVDASTFARATGGIDGDWYYYANVQPGTNAYPFSGVADGNYIIHPDLPSQHEKSDTEDATKISYYTPRIAGFQAGVSYTNDQGDAGTAAGFSANDDSFQYHNVWSGGVNYTGQFSDVGVAASLTGETGKDENNDTRSLKAWAAGANVSYMGFTVGGSYGDWNKSQIVDAPAFNGLDANYWTLGGAYAFGPAAVSVTYLDSEYADSAGFNNNFQNLVLGADYQLAPGFVPYVEVSFFNTKTDANGAGGDNDGSVWLAGTELTF